MPTILSSFLIGVLCVCVRVCLCVCMYRHLVMIHPQYISGIHINYIHIVASLRIQNVFICCNRHFVLLEIYFPISNIANYSSILLL